MRTLFFRLFGLGFLVLALLEAGGGAGYRAFVSQLLSLLQQIPVVGVFLGWGGLSSLTTFALFASVCFFLGELYALHNMRVKLLKSIRKR